MWDLWWRKCHCNMFFSAYFVFPCQCHSTTAVSGVPWNFVREGGGGSTNSVEDRGQGYWGGNSLVRGSGGRNFIPYSKIFLIFDTLRLFMMTTNLFVIANVKQLRTGGSFRILLHFFRTSWSVGVLNSAIFNSFHNRIEFGTILEGLRNFGEGWTPQSPPPSAPHWLLYIYMSFLYNLCYVFLPSTA